MNGWSRSIPSRWSDAHALFQGPLALTVVVPLSACRGRAGAQTWDTLLASGRILTSMGRVRRGGRGFPGAWRSSRMRPDSPTMAAPEEPLRRRKAGDADPGPGSPPGPGRDPAGPPSHLRAGTFWLTRIVLLRALAFVYCESAGAGLPLVSPVRVRPQTPPVTLPGPAPRPPLRLVHSRAPCHITLPFTPPLPLVRGSG